VRARRRGALATLAGLVAVVVFAAVGLAADRFSAKDPALTHLMYALDADTKTAEWLSDEPAVQKWTGQFVSGDPHTVDATLPAFGAEKMRTGPAMTETLPAPKLTLESDTRSGDGRTMKLKLVPQRSVRLTTLHVAAGVAVASATVGGRAVPVTGKTEGPWGFGFAFHAPPPEGVEIVLTVRGTAPVKFRAMDASDGLSDIPGFRPRPAGVGVVGSHTSEMLAVAATYTL